MSFNIVSRLYFKPSLHYIRLILFSKLYLHYFTHLFIRPCLHYIWWITIPVSSQSLKVGTIFFKSIFYKISLKVGNLVQIELSYINTNHPDFSDGASVVSSVLAANEMVSYNLLVFYFHNYLYPSHVVGYLIFRRF